jgi:hypothetical protein
MLGYDLDVNPRGRTLVPCALALFGLALGGCSQGSQSRELRTRSQAAIFVVEVAGGEPVDKWKLASNATADADEAWEERAAIADLGRLLAHEGSQWACEFAQRAIGFGTSGETAHTLARRAAGAGAPASAISSALHDLATLHSIYFVLATTGACGP